MQDQMSGVENAGAENEGSENQDQKWKTNGQKLIT